MSFNQAEYLANPNPCSYDDSRSGYPTDFCYTHQAWMDEHKNIDPPEPTPSEMEEIGNS